MDPENWPLTSRAIVDSERAAGPGEFELTDDDEPDRGNALLRLLVAESDGRIQEFAPGCFYESKLDDETVRRRWPGV
jgi:crotonobetainyl-CoA:carnitine CoA-transferase CaiB-like acyl-CoA transferase